MKHLYMYLYIGYLYFFHDDSDYLSFLESFEIVGS